MCKYKKHHQVVKEKNVKTYKMSVEMFRSDIISSLFNICSCKCNDLNKSFCTAPRKVPQIEHEFLKDQKNMRVMIIGGTNTP